MFEHRHEPLLPRRLFLHRIRRSAVGFLGVIAGSLALGAVGYRMAAGLSWAASMTERHVPGHA